MKNKKFQNTPKISGELLDSFFGDLAFCMSCIESICCYNNRKCDVNDRLLSNYVDQFGENTVKRMIEYVQSNIKEIGYAGTDLEGCPYNYIDFNNGTIDHRSLDRTRDFLFAIFQQRKSLKKWGL